MNKRLSKSCQEVKLEYQREQEALNSKIKSDLSKNSLHFEQKIDLLSKELKHKDECCRRYKEQIRELKLAKYELN